MHAAARGLGGLKRVDLKQIDRTAVLPTKPIAYLTSQYGRAGDTFIRTEVEALRRLGFTVHTFSVRAPVGGEFIENDAVRREREATRDIVSAGLLPMIAGALRLAVSRPARFARALRLTARIGNPGIRGRLYPLAYLLEAALLARWLEAKNVGHLHNHLGRNSAAVAMLASVLSGIPYSLTIHGPTEFDMAGSLALDEKIGRAKFTVGISDFGRSQLMRFSRLRDWPRIRVVRCALGDEFRRAAATPVPDVRRLVCVARLVEQKGHPLLVEAVHQLVEEGHTLQLDLVGDGPLRKTIESEIRARGLESHVKLLGWRGSDEVRRIIESSRAMVLPSFAEGLPVSLMEAMALARPVIATRVGAVNELVEHGVHGWVVPAGSVDALAGAMREALDAPVGALTEMGRTARERVLERHDADREARKLASLLTA
jgi:glycosyltransferase involved in cell wall biosynthesis